MSNVKDKGGFLNLFLKYRNEVVKVFQWMSDKEARSATVHINSFKIAYFCQNNKTAPFPTKFPTNWQNFNSFSFGSEKFSDPTLSSFSLSQWITFLREKTPGTNFDNPSSFSPEDKLFWYTFSRAYQNFLNLSRLPQNDNSFLFFLDNLKFTSTINMLKRLLALKRAEWTKELPDINLKSWGDKNIDLASLFSIDASSFNLDNLTNQQLIDLKVGQSLYSITATDLDQNYQRDSSFFKQLLQVVQQSNFWKELNEIVNNSWGIQFLFFNDERYSLKNLIASFRYQEGKRQDLFLNNLNDLARTELTKIIFGNKRGIDEGTKDADRLQQHFAQTKTKLLTDLKIALETLQKVDPKTTQLPINEKKYTIDQLLQATNQLLNDQLDQKVIDQIKPLFSNSIYATDITKVTNQLKKYREIIDFLKKLTTNQKLTSLKISNQNYSFTSLIADAKKEFIKFSQDSFTELQNLVDQDISLEKLETAYQESLPSPATETKSPTKKSTNQNLVIGLGTAGGAVALIGAGGFVYWFLKIRKS